MTKSEAVSAAKKQLAYYLREEAARGEMLMKEVWEECDGGDDTKAVEAWLMELAEELDPEGFPVGA